MVFKEVSLVKEVLARALETGQSRNLESEEIGTTEGTDRHGRRNRETGEWTQKAEETWFLPNGSLWSEG